MAPGPCDVGQRERRLRLDAHRRRDLPALAEVARGALAPVPSVAMPPLPFSPVKFSGLIERVLASRQPRQVAEAEAQTVESRLGHERRRGEERGEE